MATNKKFKSQDSMNKDIFIDRTTFANKLKNDNIVYLSLFNFINFVKQEIKNQIKDNIITSIKIADSTWSSMLSLNSVPKNKVKEKDIEKLEKEFNLELNKLENIFEDFIKQYGFILEEDSIIFIRR